MVHKVENCFFDHDKNFPCVSTSISLNDNLVASGSADGTLICRSLKDNAIILQDKSRKSSITQLRFSPTSNKTLAVAYNSGEITLWDMHQKILKHGFKAHASACTGIAYSPVNNLLMCSVGKDEKIHFFDIIECREVKEISTGAALSCISFCNDGHTIAVGCE